MIRPGSHAAPRGKSADQIAQDLELKAKEFLDIARELKGHKKPGRKPASSPASKQRTKR